MSLLSESRAAQAFNVCPGAFPSDGDARPSPAGAPPPRPAADNPSHVFWIAALPEGAPLYISQAFETVWGFSGDLGMREPERIAAAVHPDDRERWAAARIRLDGADTEYRIRRPDGETRWILESVFPVPNDVGRPARLAGVARDVTERKRAEAALRASEERFRQFFDLNPLPGCLFDALTGEIIEVNAAFERLTGYPRAALQGQSFGNLELWLDRTLPQLILTSLQQDIAPQAFDIATRSSAGQIQEMTFSLSLATIDGQRRVVAAATDMTALNRLRAQLAESEARFRSLVESAPDLLICTTLNGEVTYVNHADQGYQASDLIGRNLLDCVVDAHALREVMRQVAATEQPVSFEAQLRLPDGRLSWRAGRVAPVQRGEAVSELLFRLRDIADRKAAETKLQKLNADISEANAKLRELDRLKARFAAMLVHDLRSPLGCVYSALELFEAADKLDEDTRRLVGVARNSLERALNLLSEVQEVYRAEEASVTLERAPLDVAAMVAEAMEMIRPEAERKGVALKYQPFNAFPLPPLQADRGKLLRAVGNLLANAVKFTPQDGRVTVSAAVVNGSGVNIGRDFIEISVTDTGIGIPPEDLPYVFDAYRQSRNHRMGVGVGLGLSIVKSIVAAHGGDARVESQLGVGTSFTIALPLQEAAD